MPAIVKEQPGALERLSSAAPCGRSAKADLHPHTDACDMRSPAADALKLTAKQETAADAAGISQSRLSHKFKDGTLTLAQMEAFGPAFAAKYGQELVERYGPLTDPKAQARLMVRAMRQQLDALEQYLEHVA